MVMTKEEKKEYNKQYKKEHKEEIKETRKKAYSGILIIKMILWSR